MTAMQLPDAEIVVGFTDHPVKTGINSEGVPTRISFRIDYDGDGPIRVGLCHGASSKDLVNARRLIKEAQACENLQAWRIKGGAWNTIAMYQAEEINESHHDVLRECVDDECIDTYHEHLINGEMLETHTAWKARTETGGAIEVIRDVPASPWRVEGWHDSYDQFQGAEGLEQINTFRELYAEALRIADGLNGGRLERRTEPGTPETGGRGGGL